MNVRMNGEEQDGVDCFKYVKCTTVMDGGVGTD